MYIGRRQHKAWDNGRKSLKIDGKEEGNTMLKIMAEISLKVDGKEEGKKAKIWNGNGIGLWSWKFR